jgi:hypothetical protein
MDAQVRSRKAAPWRDDLPFVSISRLVASGEIAKDTTRAVVNLGGLTREVRVVHRRFQNGGHWSFFLCAECGARARKLRLLDGSPMCWRCCIARGAVNRATWGSMADRREARSKHIGALIDVLNGPALRLRPRSDRRIDRVARLTLALQKALLSRRRVAVRAAQALLKPPRGERE